MTQRATTISGRRNVIRRNPPWRTSSVVARRSSLVARRWTHTPRHGPIRSHETRPPVNAPRTERLALRGRQNVELKRQPPPDGRAKRLGANGGGGVSSTEDSRSIQKSPEATRTRVAGRGSQVAPCGKNAPPPRGGRFASSVGDGDRTAC